MTYGNPCDPRCFPCADACSTISRIGATMLSLHVGLTGGARAAVSKSHNGSAISQTFRDRLILSRMQHADQCIASSAMGPDGWTPAVARVLDSPISK
jgi:hypothetical protein